MRRPGALFVAGSLGALFVLSCQLLLDVERPRADPDPPDVIEDPCPHRRPPERPSKDDDPSKAVDFWLAVESLEVPVKLDGGNHPGYDLDDSCTCMPDRFDGGPPCITPAATPEARTECDFDGGVDDSVAAITSSFRALADEYDIGEVVNRRIREGSQTLLIHVSGYNGEANDTDVAISFVSSGGIRTLAGCTDAPRGAFGDAGVAPPQWDGCDRWSPRRGLTFGQHPSRTPTGATDGYVAGHVLVARVPTLNMAFFGSQTTFSDGIVVLNLVKDPTGHGFGASGLITGRLPARQMAEILGRAEVSADDGSDRHVPLCTTKFWPIVAPALCETRDTMESRSQERQPGAVCNASTMALAFRARPANVADEEFEPVDESFAGCPDSAEVKCSPVE